jgi:ParB-like chromosome segregation protein Spo0J
VALVDGKASEGERMVRVDALGERLGALRLCEPESLAAMRQSLAKHGQLQAAVVFTASGGGLEVIDGFKRLRAARALGWSELCAHVLAVDVIGAKVAIDALHDHGGLSELEQAWLVRSLYREDQLDQPSIGRLLGRHKSWVCRRLMLAEGLDDAVQADVRLGLLAPSAAACLTQLQRGNQRPAAQVVTRTGLTCRQTAQLVAELLASSNDAARARLLQERLDHPAPRAAPKPARRERTPAEWLMADIATLTRVAARLQARLCGQPLTALGPRVAELAAHALSTLTPVLAALGQTITTVTGKDRHVSMEHSRGAGAEGRHAPPAGTHPPRDRAGVVDQPQHGP